MCRPFSEERGALSHVRLRKMRVIKSDYGYAQDAPDLQCFPTELIGISRLDHVRLFPFQNFFHCAKVQQRAILRCSRDNWRTNCVNTRAPVSFEPGLRAGNNKDVLVAGRLSVDVIDLLMKIPLHAAAYRRIELGEVADLHGIGDLRLPIADLREAAMIATSSPASLSRGRILSSLSKPESMINSNQKQLSSASSSTIPIFAINSARDRARHAAR